MGAVNVVFYFLSASPTFCKVTGKKLVDQIVLILKTVIEKYCEQVEATKSMKAFP